MKLEDFKAIIAVNPKAKFKFDLAETCYSFNTYPDVTGVITFDSWGNDSVIWADVAGYDDLLSFNVREIELHKESSEDIEPKKLKFPCCVPTSQIKDEATMQKLVELFVANGASKSDYEYERKTDWNYFGVDIVGLTTEYYDDWESFSNCDGDEDTVTIYSIEELLPTLVEEAPVKVEPVIFPIGTEVKIAESSKYYECGEDYNPINIKGNIVRNHSPYGDGFTYQVEWSNGCFNSYKLNDLVLWEEEVVESTTEDNPWIEWNGSEEPPVVRGTKVDIKYHDGTIAIGIGSQDGSEVEGCDYTCSSWYYPTGNLGNASITAYRLHNPVASQEAIVDVSNSKPSVGIDSYDSGYKEPTEPLVSITKEVKYTVTIKGVDFTFTQDEINELTTELGAFEDYE